jgi:hypothetical protein
MIRPTLDDNSTDASILDDLFHGCAVAAFIERMSIDRAMPDPEATRRLAYQLYESELRRKNGAEGAGDRSNT